MADHNPGLWAGAVSALAVGFGGMVAKWKFATKHDMEQIERRLLDAIGEDRRRLDKGDENLMSQHEHDIVCGRNTAELKLFLNEQFAAMRQELKANGYYAYKPDRKLDGPK